jgi:hypothetical protein
MPHEIDRHRRHFFGIAAGTLAAGLAVTASAKAQSGSSKSAKLAATNPGTNTSFGPLKQIDAGLLNVGYAEDGPADGPAVILLHGWPYDIQSFADVTPLLARAGYRVIVPYLRGYGTTKFFASETFRNGQPAALAADIIALMDALAAPGMEAGPNSGDYLIRCVTILNAAGSPTQTEPRRTKIVRSEGVKLLQNDFFTPVHLISGRRSGVV